jgi:prepilin-type N-terminal cleavage/methylation domain-containing protein
MQKKKAGFTLTELMLVIAIFAILAVTIGVLLYNSLESVSNNVALLDDQYSTRMALLSIIQEIRYGVEVIQTGEGILVLDSLDVGNITYSLNSGRLIRTGASTVHFVSPELSSFETVLNGNQLTIMVQGRNNSFSLTTTIAISRIHQPPPEST